MFLRICPLCGEMHSAIVYEIEREIAQKMIAKIRGDHPHWIQKNGLCERCVNYYKNLITHPKNRKTIAQIIHQHAKTRPKSSSLL